MCVGDHCVVLEHWVQFYHDAHSAHTAFLDPIPTVYIAMRNFCLGSLDTPQFGYVGQLLAVGHH